MTVFYLKDAERFDESHLKYLIFVFIIIDIYWYLGTIIKDCSRNVKKLTKSREKAQ